MKDQTPKSYIEDLISLNASDDEIIRAILLTTGVPENLTGQDENPFFLFAGSDYYPSGGFLDLEGKFKTLKEAIDYMDNIDLIEDTRVYEYDWYHIVRNNEVVFSARRNGFRDNEPWQIEE